MRAGVVDGTGRGRPHGERVVRGDPRHPHPAHGLGGDRAGGVADDRRQVDLLEHLVDDGDEVDPADDRLDVELGGDGVDVERGGDGVDVDPRDDRVDVDALHGGVEVGALDHRIHVELGGDGVEVDPVDDGIQVDAPDRGVEVDRRDDLVEVDVLLDEAGEVQAFDDRRHDDRCPRVEQRVSPSAQELPVGPTGQGQSPGEGRGLQLLRHERGTPEQPRHRLRDPVGGADRGDRRPHREPREAECDVQDPLRLRGEPGRAQRPSTLDQLRRHRCTRLLDRLLPAPYSPVAGGTTRSREWRGEPAQPPIRTAIGSAASTVGPPRRRRRSLSARPCPPLSQSADPRTPTTGPRRERSQRGPVVAGAPVSAARGTS